MLICYFADRSQIFGCWSVLFWYVLKLNWNQTESKHFNEITLKVIISMKSRREQAFHIIVSSGFQSCSYISRGGAYRAKIMVIFFYKWIPLCIVLKNEVIFWTKNAALCLHMTIFCGQIYIIGQNFKVLQITSNSVCIWSIECSDLWWKDELNRTHGLVEMVFFGTFSQKRPKIRQKNAITIEQLSDLVHLFTIGLQILWTKFVLNFKSFEALWNVDL